MRTDVEEREVKWKEREELKEIAEFRGRLESTERERESTEKEREGEGGRGRDGRKEG